MRRDLEGWFDRYRRQGDLRALERVFDRTARDLLGLAQHLVRDPDDAEDLVQATFVTAIDRAPTYDRARPLRPWLSGILARHAANLMRGRTRRAATEEGLPGCAGHEPDPAQGLETRELDGALEAALARVGAPYREVLEAYLVAGERPEEIARRLERAPGTVRSQIYRGLERLRRLLPAGVGAAFALATVRGLETVRAAVLRHATEATAAAIPATSFASGLAIGGLVLGKKTLLVGAGAALASAGIWFTAGPGLEPLVPDLPEAARVEAAPALLDAPPGRLSAPAAPAAPLPPLPSARAAVRQGRLVVRGRLIDARPEHVSGFAFALSRHREQVEAEDRLLSSIAGAIAADQSNRRIVETRPQQLFLRQRMIELFTAVESQEVAFDLTASGDGGPRADLVVPPGLEPGRVAFPEDGGYEFELTPVQLEPHLAGELVLDLRASHELYFDDQAVLTLSQAQLARVCGGDEVALQIDLRPRPAAVLRGVARKAVERPPEEITGEPGLNESLEGLVFGGSAQITLDVSTSRVMTLERGSFGGAQPMTFSFVMLPFDPVELALLRPGGEKPIATTRAGHEGEFVFKVDQGGPFVLVALASGRPPVTRPAELELAAAVELEEPLEVEHGPRLEGVVEDFGAFPGGGLGLEARRVEVQGDRPLRWSRHALAWSGAGVVRTRARAESSNDGTFSLEGLSPGAHRVGLDDRAETLFDPTALEAVRVEAPVPASGLQLVLPICVVEVAARLPLGMSFDDAPHLGLSVSDAESGAALGEVDLDGEGRVDLVAHPSQALLLQISGEGLEFPATTVTGPEAGQRRRVPVQGTR